MTDLAEGAAHARPHRISRTSAGLREALFDEWDALNWGASNPKIAMAKAGLAKQIINSVKVEIEFASHVRAAKEGEVTALNAPLDLAPGEQPWR